MTDLPLFARPLFDPEGLTPDQLRVAQALGRGREEARRIADLATETGLSDRDVQSIVEDLILKHHVPVGSSMRPPYGNYLIVDREDLDRTETLLRDRAIKGLRRAAALKGMAVQDYMRRVQTSLPLDEDEAA